MFPEISLEIGGRDLVLILEEDFFNAECAEGYAENAEFLSFISVN